MKTCTHTNYHTHTHTHTYYYTHTVTHILPHAHTHTHAHTNPCIHAYRVMSTNMPIHPCIYVYIERESEEERDASLVCIYTLISVVSLHENMLIRVKE